MCRERSPGRSVGFMAIETVVGRVEILAAISAELERGRSVLLVGEAGVGKSHVADVAAHRAATAPCGAALVSITGSQVVGGIPFGAVAHLLGADARVTAGQLVAQVTEYVTERQRAGAIVVVDDIDLIDDASSEIVRRVAANGAVIATVRSESSGEPAVVGQWKSERFDRIEVGPLARPEADALAAVFVTGDLSTMLSLRLWERARGNPLLIRELCLAGCQSGAIAQAGARHELVGDLAPSDRIIDLVVDRLRSCSYAEAVVLTGAVLLDSLSPAVVAALGSPSVVRSLERDGLLKTIGRGAGLVARPAHPIVAEAVRGWASPALRSGLVDRLVEVVDKEHLGSGELVRVAGLLLDEDREPSATVALDAATAALDAFDFEHAERFASFARRSGSELGSEIVEAATEVLAAACAGAGDVEEADRLLGELRASTDDAQRRVRATLAHGQLLMWSAGRAGDAVDLLQSELAVTVDPDDRDRLRLSLALALGVIAQLRHAREVADELLDRRTLDPAVELRALMVRTLSDAMTGDVGDSQASFDRVVTLLEITNAPDPLLRDQIGLNAVLVATARCELDEAFGIADAARRADDFAGRVTGPWLYVTVPALLLAGAVDRAAADADEAVRLLRRSDLTGTLPLALALAATAHAVRGQADEARSLIAQGIAAGGLDQVRCEVWLRVAEAWVSAVDGEVPRAAAMVASAAERAIDNDHVVWGAIAAHQATMLGCPDEVDSLLGALDAGPLVDLLADHAAARGGTELRATVQRFVDRGMLASAATAAATLAADDAETAEASRVAAVQALTLWRRCPAFWSPVLAAVEVPLSERQLEVARLAAAGNPSSAIGDQLFVSTKTVDNHLHAVYRTFGIGSRDELAEVLRYDEPT